MIDPTYVCDECAHQWCSPEWPERCENCRAGASWLKCFHSSDDADDYSEYVARLDAGPRLPYACKCGQLSGDEKVCDACRRLEREPQGETVRLFAPAPAQIPGQLLL